MNTEITNKKAEKQADVSVSVTDLRIGNLIHYNNNHKEIGKISLLVSDIVDALSYCQINYRRDKKHWLINLQPVKLTEDWLTAFGFIKLGELDFFYILESEMNLKISCDLKMVAWYNLQLHNVKIKYVHQLQNLHFALTGYELQVVDN